MKREPILDNLGPYPTPETLVDLAADLANFLDRLSTQGECIMSYGEGESGMFKAAAVELRRLTRENYDLKYSPCEVVSPDVVPAQGTQGAGVIYPTITAGVEACFLKAERERDALKASHKAAYFEGYKDGFDQEVAIIARATKAESDLTALRLLVGKKDEALRAFLTAAPFHFQKLIGIGGDALVLTADSCVKEVEELRKDKVRLDWLEASLADITWSSNEGWFVTTKNEDNPFPKGETCRAAIDATREAKEAGK